mmetsp:Transcript_19707/g.50918  ORF Transcript_19707/g.50918 Transcript_19707/m.50918 type:complete len:254 (+) Transcript_19707:243-1004(+)
MLFLMPSFSRRPRFEPCAIALRIFSLSLPSRIAPIRFCTSVNSGLLAASACQHCASSSLTGSGHGFGTAGRSALGPATPAAMDSSGRYIPLYARSRISSSNMMIANENWSTVCVYFSPRKFSGAMYRREPTSPVMSSLGPALGSLCARSMTLLRACSLRFSISNEARPKSATLATRSLPQSIMFPGLRSRWMMLGLHRCRNSMPRATSCAQRSPSLSVYGFSILDGAWIMSLREPWLPYSRTSPSSSTPRLSA